MSRIYRSKHQSVQIPECSLFTYLFKEQDKLVGGWDGSIAAYVDAATGTTLTRKFIRDTALSLGHGLLHNQRFPLKKGDTVMVFSPNSVAFPVIFHGTVAAGMRATLANSAYTAPELEYQYKDSQAKVVFTTEEGLAIVLDMFKRIGLSPPEAAPRIIVIDTGFSWAGGPHVEPSLAVTSFVSLGDLLKKGRLSEEAKFDGRNAHETVLLCYSSGTTGKPKGVEVWKTHFRLFCTS